MNLLFCENKTTKKRIQPQISTIFFFYMVAFYQQCFGFLFLFKSLRRASFESHRDDRVSQSTSPWSHCQSDAQADSASETNKAVRYFSKQVAKQSVRGASRIDLRPASSSVNPLTSSRPPGVLLQATISQLTHQIWYINWIWTTTIPRPYKTEKKKQPWIYKNAAYSGGPQSIPMPSKRQSCQSFWELFRIITDTVAAAMKKNNRKHSNAL